MRLILIQRQTKTRQRKMSMSEQILAQITDGRTDLVIDCLSAGHSATSADQNGVPLIQWCAYYGDVTAVKYLFARGESIQSLSDNLGLSAAAFHGDCRLCQYLIEATLHDEIGKDSDPSCSFIVSRKSGSQQSTSAIVDAAK